mgnify:CR=1 FL=1
MATRQKFNFIIIVGLVIAGLGCKPPGARALFKGEKLLQKGDAKAAVVEFERAVDILPQEWRAWNYLGLARHRAGDLNGADEAYQAAVKFAGERWRSPNDSSFVLYFNQGRLNLDRGRLADAQRQLHTFALQKQTFKSLFWMAEAFRRNGDIIQAKETFLLALDKNNNSPVAHNRLGLVQLKLNNPAGAVPSFQMALELKPEFDQAQLNLALTYHRYTPLDYPNRDTLALEAFKAYIKMNPKPAPAVQEMADALQAKLNPATPPSDPLKGTNKLEIVQTFTNQFLKGSPSTNLVIEVPPIENTNTTTVVEVPSAPSIHLPSSTARGTLSESNPSVTSSDEHGLPAVAKADPLQEEVESEVPQTASIPNQPKSFVVPEMPGVARYKYLKPERPESGVVEDPKRLKALFDEAFHRYNIKEYAESIAVYRKVLEVNPAHQEAYLNIAIAMQVTGEVKASLPVYERALAINPLSNRAREGFASALNQSEYYVDAAREFHVLLEVHRNNVPAHLGLGVLYARHLNEPEKAEHFYRRVLELNPQHTEGANIRQWLYNRSRQ